MRRYSIGSVKHGEKTFFYIYEKETLDLVLLPTKFLKHKANMNRSPNTVRGMAHSICYYLEYLDEKNMKLDQISELRFEEQNDHFIGFLYWLKESNHTLEKHGKIISNKSCNSYLKSVFRYISYLIENGYCSPLKVVLIKPVIIHNGSGIGWITQSTGFSGYLPEKEPNVRAAKETEIINAIEACTNSRDKLILLLLAETGFRIGELLGIRYSQDIDYENHTISVYFRDNNENNARAKNAENRREKISNETFDFMMQYICDNRMILQKQHYLFVNIAGKTAGKPLVVDTVYCMLQSIEEKTGIKITPHMLRRYFANARWEAGWPIELISKAMGHKRVETTMKYLGVLDDQLMKASTDYFEQKRLYINQPEYRLEKKDE